MPGPDVLFAKCKHPPVFRACRKCRKETWCYAIGGVCPPCNRDQQTYYRERRRQGHKLRQAPLPASRTPTTVDLAWAAGFLEGEGWFGERHGSACVTATQVEWEPIARLVQFFGGSVTPGYPKNPKHTPYLNWRVAGARARGVMLTLYPFLSPKRRARIKECL